tara:strand:- start:685 stop:1317 length:633 start_codon:yes stop_codon:yes gene_type:complete
MAEERMGAYKRKGAAESKELSEDGPVIDENKKTAGPAEFGGKKGDDSKSKKDYEGPGRSMGYTQNFGPARVNGYTKGAAKVNSIMGRGAAQLDADALSKFAINQGKEQQTEMKADAKREGLLKSAGQYKDSLNLVKSGQGDVAKNMYGDALAFGNVAGSESGNITKLSPTGVNPGSQGVKQFGVDETKIQKEAGRSLISSFQAQQRKNQG